MILEAHVILKVLLIDINVVLSESLYVGMVWTAIYAIFKQKSTTNTLKAYLSTQPSYLSAFVISKTHRVAQSLAEDS